MSPRVDVAVLGGGVSGLAAAHRLTEAGVRFALFESESRPGGPVRSEVVDGVLLEGGPDQFVTAKPSGVDLCRRLGLETEIVRPPGAPLQVVHRGRPTSLPEGFGLVGPARAGKLIRSPLFSWAGMLRVLREPLVGPRTGDGDESVERFVTRRFGGELYRRIVEPVVGGIYTADASSLSAELALPRLVELERRHGRISPALRKAVASRRSPGFAALAGGMQTLVDRLTARLPAESLFLRAPVARIVREAEGWTVVTGGGGRCSARAVVLALPAPAAARVLGDLDRRLSRRLGSLGYASCAVVNLRYPKTALSRKLDGHGFFVPESAGLSILACSYVDRKFPERAPHDQALFRVFVGGIRRPELLDWDDEGLAELAHRSLVGLLGIEGRPTLRRVCRHVAAMPQYPVGYSAVRQQIGRRLARHEGLFLCGTADGAFGMPEAIASGEGAAGDAVRLVERASARDDLRAVSR